MAVSAEPVRAVRVGRTQSNMSMPAPITRRMPSASPIPMKYRGFAGGQQRRRPAGGLEHLLAALADREPAERVAVEVERGDLLDRAAAKLRVGGALRDPEEELTGRALGLPLPLGPERRPPHRLLELGRAARLPAGRCRGTSRCPSRGCAGSAPRPPA